MNQDKIKQWAMESGFRVGFFMAPSNGTISTITSIGTTIEVELSKFAALVAAHEREQQQGEAVAQVIGWIDGYSTEIKDSTKGMRSPLTVFTHPAPSRQPLSEKRMHDLVTDWFDDGGELTKRATALCRALERIHRIGGEK